MDFHFLIRNGLSGGIFLAVALLGVWVVSPADLITLISAIKESQTTIITVVAAAAPVIGICLQSLVLVFRYSRRDFFTDKARVLIAERFREAIRSNPAYRRSFEHLLDPKFDDRVFVSIYYRIAQPHLVEWARRRRSYNYLGETSACAVVLGFLGGVGLTKTSHQDIWQSGSVRFSLVAALGIIWIVASLGLARKMRQDADRMELAWAIYELAPDLANRMKTGTEEDILRGEAQTMSLTNRVLLLVTNLLSNGK